MSIQLALDAIFILALAFAASVGQAMEAKTPTLADLENGTNEAVYLKVTPKLHPTVNRAGFIVPRESMNSLVLPVKPGENVARKSFLITMEDGYRAICDLETHSLLGTPISISSKESFQLVDATRHENNQMTLVFRSTTLGRMVYKPSLKFTCSTSAITIPAFVAGLRANGLDAGTVEAINTHKDDDTAFAVRRPTQRQLNN